MNHVPVVSITGLPLMPCHPARARQLIRGNRAIKRFSRGLVYLQMTTVSTDETQEVACGIDPGSKYEGFSVRDAKRTFINIHANAVIHISRALKQRRDLRRSRRGRNTPHRRRKANRGSRGIPASTKARWYWKYRIAKWLSSLYPISIFVIEDTSSRNRSRRRSRYRFFSPIKVGKLFLYGVLSTISPVLVKKGICTKTLREAYGVRKIPDKAEEVWEAHCVDAWVLATEAVSGSTVPDNKSITRVAPIKLNRRQLHITQPEKGGVRRRYGGTRSQGIKRGSWVLHTKWGCCFVGGSSKGFISLHSIRTGKRLTQKAKPYDCKLLCYSSWRTWSV
jgi:hypothetical protein